VLVNRTRKTAEAVATYIQYVTPLSPKVDLKDGDYDALAGAGVVLITFANVLGRGIAHLTIYLPRFYGFSTLGELLQLFALASLFTLATSFMGQAVGAWFARPETRRRKPGPMVVGGKRPLVSRFPTTGSPAFTPRNAWTRRGRRSTSSLPSSMPSLQPQNRPSQKTSSSTEKSSPFADQVRRSMNGVSVPQDVGQLAEAGMIVEDAVR
jgi:hypothetical protein